jgi:hypothetical protein
MESPILQMSTIASLNNGHDVGLREKGRPEAAL